MKRLYSNLTLLFLLVFTVASADLFGAVITSNRTGNWGNNNTWNGNVPGINDDAIIQNGHTVTLRNAGECKSITIEAGGTLVIDNNTLTVHGDITNNSFVTLTTGHLNQAASGNLTNTGTITYTGTGTLTLRGSYINSGTLTLGATVVNFVGNNAASSTVSGFTTTGAINLTRTSGSITLTGNINGNTITINGAGGTFNLGDGNNHSFSGAITISNGTFQGGSSTINVNATVTPWLYNGGLFQPQSGTVVFGASGNQTIGGSSTNTFNNLTLSGSGTKTLPSHALNLTGNLILGGSVSVTPSHALSVGGDLQIGSGTTLNAGTLTHNIGGNITVDGNFNVSTGAFNLNGNSTQIIGGSLDPITFHNLSLANKADVQLSAGKNISVNSELNITDSASFTIGSGRMVTANKLINNSETVGILIESSASNPNGSLIFFNSEEEPVEATVQMYSQAFYDAAGPAGFKYKWQFFGIPVRSLNSASPTFDGSFVRRHNEPGTGSGIWVTMNNSSSFSSLTGYQITQMNGKTINFRGVLENRNLERDLSYTETASFPGQHVLSNPYTAAIDIREIVFDSDIDPSIFFFNTGSKADWEEQTGNDRSPGQYLVVPRNQAGQGSLPLSIPSMQGFLVTTQAPHNDTKIQIPYSSVALKNAETLRSRSTLGLNPYTKIKVSDSKLSDQVWLFTKEGTSKGFDKGWDGRKIGGSATAPLLYTVESDGFYQVSTAENINNTILRFRPGTSSNQYSLYFEHGHSEHIYESIYLTDILNNITVDVTQSGSVYHFTAEGNTAQDRFKITSIKWGDADVAEDEIDEEEISVEGNFRVYFIEGNLWVNNPSNNPGEVMLYNLRQNMVEQFSFGPNTQTSFALNLPPGVYLAKASAGRLKKNATLVIK